MYRQKRVVGMLLILQSVVFVGIGVRLFTVIDWDRAISLADEQNLPQNLEQQLERAVVFALLFLGPTVLLRRAGLSFVLLRRRGWLLASVAEGAILLSCLFVYPDPRPGFTYPLIAYSILMVLYLNSQGVRAVFHSRRAPLGDGEAGTAHGG